MAIDLPSILGGGGATAVALIGTWNYVIPALMKKNQNGNGASGCKAAGAVGSMPSETLCTSIGVAVGKEIINQIDERLVDALDRQSSSMDRMSAAQEEANKQMLIFMTRMQTESEFRRGRGRSE